MDYDKTQIPAAYDRSRELDPAMVALWMDAVARHLGDGACATILDLGCGTGRFTEALAQRFGAEVIGIDPSTGMLERAREKRRDERVRYQLGHAEAIPLSDRAVDVIFISMVLHHFNDPRAAALECRRVLREQGTVFVRTGTRERIGSYAYVPFFPSTPALLSETLPDRASVQQLFETAGFQLLAAEVITQVIAPDWAAYADRIAAGGDSVLSRLEPEEFARGVAALRSHALGATAEPVIEPIDLFVLR
jgi:ubiquinone/menaquinone biosynthesis C-methylase UbiE